MLLILYAKVEFFDLFLHQFVLLKEGVDELFVADFLVIALVHHHEQLRTQIIEAVPQIVLLLLTKDGGSLTRGVPLGRQLVASHLHHIHHQFVLVDIAVVVSVNGLELPLQVIIELLVVSVFFDGIGAVNVDVVDVGSLSVWISH